MLNHREQQWIGEFVHEQRILRNWSTDDLARIAGISAKEVMFIEIGKFVSMLCLTAIARAFEMYTSELLKAAIPNLSETADVYLDVLYSEMVNV